MKRKWPIRAMAVLLCMCMTILCSVSAYAVETRASERIYHSAATLLQKSNGDLSIGFSVRATGRMDVIGASIVQVQRYTGSTWVTEHTFTPSNTPEIQAESKPQHSATLTYSPLFTGKEYRAVVMIYVKDASGSSSQQLTSRTIST